MILVVGVLRLLGRPNLGRDMCIQVASAVLGILSSKVNLICCQWVHIKPGILLIA